MVRTKFNVNGELQVGGACRAYETKTGMHAEVLICSGKRELRIAGDGAWMLKMLREAIEVITDSAQYYIEDGYMASDWMDKTRCPCAECAKERSDAR